MLSKVFKTVCTSATVVSPDFLCPTPTSSAVKTPETQRTLMSEPTDGDMQMECPVISCTAQVSEPQQKIAC
jgi:hypothetical protein